MCTSCARKSWWRPPLYYPKKRARKDIEEGSFVHNLVIPSGYPYKITQAFPYTTPYFPFKRTICRECLNALAPAESQDILSKIHDINKKYVLKLLGAFMAVAGFFAGVLFVFTPLPFYIFFVNAFIMFFIEIFMLLKPERAAEKIQEHIDVHYFNKFNQKFGLNVVAFDTGGEAVRPVARNIYQFVELDEGEVDALADLEALIGQPVPLVDRITYDTFGFTTAGGHVTGLCLDRKMLRYLPDTIGNLVYLVSLWLNGNRLTTLPESIGNLRSLFELRLAGNQLLSLPKTIGQLKSLTVLWANNNMLVSIPDEIGGLRDLFSLALDNNQLSTLPENIISLTNLGLLLLVHNKLTFLSKKVTNWLKYLKKRRCLLKIRPSRSSLCLIVPGMIYTSSALIGVITSLLHIYPWIEMAMGLFVVFLCIGLSLVTGGFVLWNNHHIHAKKTYPSFENAQGNISLSSAPFTLVIPNIALPANAGISTEVVTPAIFRICPGCGRTIHSPTITTCVSCDTPL